MRQGFFDLFVVPIMQMLILCVALLGKGSHSNILAVVFFQEHIKHYICYSTKHFDSGGVLGLLVIALVILLKCPIII